MKVDDFSFFLENIYGEVIEANELKKIFPKIFEEVMHLNAIERNPFMFILEKMYFCIKQNQNFEIGGM